MGGRGRGWWRDEVGRVLLLVENGISLKTDESFALQSSVR